MTDLTSADLAERSGVDQASVGRLVDLGILVAGEDGRFAPGDVRRVLLVRTFERAGIAIEGIATAVRSGELSLAFADTPTYERFASLGAETFLEVSGRTGIPVDLLLVVRQAIGGPLAQPMDRMREDEVRVVPLVELQVREGFRHVAIERWLQVYGEAMRRISETEEDYFASEVIRPRLAAGSGPAEMWEAAHELSPRLAARSDDAILAIYHAHQGRSWVRGILEFVEGALEAAGLHSRLERLPAICFLDITGYTRLTEERGDEAAAELAERLARMVQRVSNRHGGEPVKWLGDGVMFHFPEPARGVLAALDMVEGVAAEGLPPAHVGLHAGPVLFQEGDYFGRTVNTASRIAGYARPGEILVSQAVVDASAGSGIAFVDVGPVELKGLTEAIHLHAARRPREAG